MIRLTLSQLRKAVYERITTYWGGATVVWGAANKVKPLAPLIVLQLGTVARAAQPVTQMVNGIVFSAYPSEVSLQVDIFTKGKTVETSGGKYNENTATNDMIDFINFLDSPATTEWSGQNDISVSLMGGVQDLSEVINDSQWQYRAMAELRITFTQWTAELNGVLSEDSVVFDDVGAPIGVNAANWKQTASGGGTDDLANEKTGFFEELPTITEEEFNNG